MARSSLALRMEEVIRAFIHSSSRANVKAIAECLSPEAVHYFPSGFGPKWTGASIIASNIANLVHERGLCWTADRVLIDADRCAGALEWTSFIRERDSIVRGVDWFVFDPQNFRIQEVRTYRAAIHPEKTRQELEDFDYAGRGYPMSHPGEGPDRPGPLP